MKSIFRNKNFLAFFSCCVVIGLIVLVSALSSLTPPSNGQDLSINIERMLRLEEVSEKALERYRVEYAEEIKILEELDDQAGESSSMYDRWYDKDLELRYATYDILVEEFEYAGFGNDLIDLEGWQGLDWWNKPPSYGLYAVNDSLFTKKGYEYFYNINFEEMFDELINLESDIEVKNLNLSETVSNLIINGEEQFLGLYSSPDDIALGVFGNKVRDLLLLKHIAVTLGEKPVLEKMTEVLEGRRQTIFDVEPAVLPKDRDLRLSKQLLEDSEKALRDLNPEFSIRQGVIDDTPFTLVDIHTDTAIKGIMIIETSPDNSEYTVVSKFLYID